MPQRFRACIIVPAGYPHAHAFVEMAMLLKHSLQDLGHHCDISCNTLATDAANILLGYHLLRYYDSLQQYRYIPWQLEQLSASEGAYSANVQALLEHAESVWDYSTDNIDFLRQRGIAALLIPPGYHEKLEQIVPQPTRDIDVLFFGSCGGRRKPVLDSLTSTQELRTEILFGVYGAERDSWIARSKIVLNIHYYALRIFEAVRIAYLLNNRCCVVSEESAAYPYPGVDLCRVPYDKLVATCIELAADPAAALELGMRTHAQFKANYRMVDLLRPVVGDGTV
jgi:hypothetical protein